MRLLYPSDPMNAKAVDETYAAEYETATAAGFDVSLFSFEDQPDNFRPRPNFLEGEIVLYRGWMLPVLKYKLLFDAISSKGGSGFTSAAHYEECHYLPRWYPVLKEFTAETVVLSEDSDFSKELAGYFWQKYFVKDYVKSLSTAGGPVASRPEDVSHIVTLMRKYRGFVEGGVCVRKYEEYIHGSEKRFFVFRAKAFSPDGNIPGLVNECASRISSPFFSVDIARRADGELRIIELGDGQVSDRKEWDPEEFINMLTYSD